MHLVHMLAQVSARIRACAPVHKLAHAGPAPAAPDHTQTEAVVCAPDRVRVRSAASLCPHAPPSDHTWHPRHVVVWNGHSPVVALQGGTLLTGPATT